MKCRKVNATTYAFEAQNEQELNELQAFTAAHPEQGPTPDELPTEGDAIATFHSIGLYWNPHKTYTGNVGIPVRYRENVPGAAWMSAFDIHYDTRKMINPFTKQPEAKARGSLVHLRPDTEYLINFGERQSGGSIKWQAQTKARTWSERFKVAKTVEVSSGASMLRCTEGGNADAGYVVYEGPAQIDVKKSAQAGVRVEASYVIVRNLTVRGGGEFGIAVAAGCHDVVIEDNDVSDWGGKRGKGKLGEYGVNTQGGVHLIEGRDSRDAATKRIVIQRNKIHDPTYGSNDWTEEKPLGPHPEGPQAIAAFNTGGNHVLRYNEVYAAEKDPRKSNRWFNDAFGGGGNDDPRGFPGPDSDIYMNQISCYMDDAIEAEGGGRNVRIWRNYIEHGGASFIATNVVHIGPTYVWRNVSGESTCNPSNGTGHAGFLKTGDRNGMGGGRKFVFHNTALKPTGYAISDVSNAVKGVYARNNVWVMNGDRGTYAIDDSDNSFDYDMTSSNQWGSMPANQERNGLLRKTAIYEQDSLELAAGSPGKGAAQPLPLFNRGEGADLGAGAFVYGLRAEGC